ncbi:MAG TPA: beta-N-acetylhexosaminidase [bacterium]|nr:beta-N-acetylhexosaminidase [bacterium]
MSRDAVAALAAQLFMVDFTGHVPAPDVVRLIEDDGIGGVILFVKNVASPRQVAVLTNSLQEIAAAAGRPPLLISADQEGGTVVRLREGATHFPSAMAFGATRSEALAASAAGVAARELAAVGIRMNLAPDVDVNNNPANPVIGIRSFGEDPALVGRLGAAVIGATQAAGVLATAKHFPGHGDTSVDSHLDLPVVPHARARLEAVELPPFREAVRAGVGAVMTAHAVYPAFDPERPATLSPVLLGLLRVQWGFSGLIVTDSMAMRAITDRFSAGEAAVLAILAGADVILACGEIAAQRDALDAVRYAVSTGRIPRARIEVSAARIRAARERLGLLRRATVAVDRVADDVGVPAHLEVAERVAEAAVTLTRPARGVIPLPPGPVAVVGVTGDARDAAERLAAVLRDIGRDAAAAAPARLDGLQAGSVVVVLGGRGGREAADPPAADLMRITVPVAAVSVGAPYALARLPHAVACLAVYGDDPPSLRAAARVLIGALEARGRLPVTLGEPGETVAETLGEP